MSSSAKARTFTTAGRILLPLLILAAGGAAAGIFLKLSRKAAQSGSALPPPGVELQTAAWQSVPLVIDSQGILEAVTETKAAAEVSGRVISVSSLWHSGAVFPAGAELLRLEDADYRAALANAEASRADAAMQLKVEQARAEQARRDWKKLGSTLR